MTKGFAHVCPFGVFYCPFLYPSLLRMCLIKEKEKQHEI